MELDADSFHPISDDALLKYVGRISQGWHEAKIVPQKPVTIGSWEPKRNACHQNVSKWLERNPTHRALRGWLVMDLRLAGAVLGAGPYVDLLAHSVVVDEQGHPFDITPLWAPPGEKPNLYPFALHPGTEDEYTGMIGGYNIARFRLYGRCPPFERIEYMPT